MNMRKTGLECKNTMFDEIIFDAMESILRENEVNLSYLVRYYIMPKHFPEYNTYNNKVYRRVYIKLYRFFKKRNDLFMLSKKDGLIWIKPKPQIIDLILTARAKFKKCKNGKPDSLFRVPSKVHSFRLEAIKKVLGYKMLNSVVKDSIESLYRGYLDDIEPKIVILKRISDAPDFVDDFVLLPYKTRFNDIRKKRAIIKKYNLVWDKASKKWDSAVFITLTTDPKLFKSLWHSWKHFGYALNRFLSFIGGRLRSRKYFLELKGKKAKKAYAKYIKAIGERSRPDYIAVYEFTKSGLLHVHLVIFGVLYLVNKRELTRLWLKYGQGAINYVYALRKRNGKWLWFMNRKPPFVKNESIQDYLKKYLLKSLYLDDANCLYWVSGKRFFSYSRSLAVVLLKYESYGWYVYVMVCHIVDIPDFVFEGLGDRPPPELNPFRYYGLITPIIR